MCDRCSDSCSKNGGGRRRRTYTSTWGPKPESCLRPEVAGDASVLDHSGVPPPRAEGVCGDPGNLTRLCTERCSSDGLSCEMQVDVDACTCAGVRLRMHEVATYDMRT